MNELQTYERIIRQKCTGRLLWQRIGLICGYFVFLSLWFVLITRIGINAPLLAMIPLSTVILILITWKYVMIEYEYTLAGGSLFLAKIYGKKKRKAILEADLTAALLIAPYTDDFIEQAERLAPTDTLWAVSSPNAEDIWMLIYDEDKDNRILLFFEADERSLRIFRHYNPRATARKVSFPHSKT